MINIQGLTKTYASGTQAVNQLSMEVKDGEILALLGPNGAGKSTTIRILTTLAGFDEGKVIVAGFDVDTDADQVRRSIGYVAQETGVDYFLTGRENMELHGRLYRMSGKDIAQRITELAGYFELTEVLDQQVVGYSGGMRRKLDIATALLHSPKLLFLDEPTLGLDTKSRQSLWKYIEKLNRELGLTILLTTHYLEEADKLSHRVAIINQGQIKIIDTPEALKSSIGGDIISLSMEGDNGHEEGLTWALKQAPFIKGTTWENDKLHLYVDNGAQAIPQVMTIATAQNAKVAQISFSRPTLDDVFIKYTGNSINTETEDSGDKWWEKWAGKGGGKWAKQWQNQAAETTDSTAETSATNTDWRETNQEWQKWQQQKQTHDAAPATTDNAWQNKAADTSTQTGDNHWQQWQTPSAKEAPTTTEDQSNNQTWPNAGEKNWQQWQQSDDAAATKSDGEKKWPNKDNWSKDWSSKKD
ncbi:MAG: ATP-binding cassette domain-containing protein [Gammaproteobacteria bacterium]|nr:ATP-binding cassette domain-containing protein [Gammaproteobacteria bacterium]